MRVERCATQGRNILISSTAPLSLLRSRVLGRVKGLNLGLGDSEYRELTERFINDASEISGDIVLRVAKRKESQKQHRDTVRRITDALFGDPERLDRDLWLSRFSDLMLHGIQFPANSPIDLGAWRMAVRDGRCGIYLRGYVTR